MTDEISKPKPINGRHVMSNPSKFGVVVSMT
jgi:hypothetical protein